MTGTRLFLSVPRRIVALGIVSAVLPCARSDSQEVIRSTQDLWDVDGRPAEGAFDFIGDITGDGVSDLVVGEGAQSTPSMFFVGRVRVYSGKDASVLYSYEGTAAFEFLGRAVAGPGDLNGDGIPEYVASNARSGMNSFVWSGSDGTELRRIETFDTVETLGDADGDGVPEFITSSGPVGAGGTVIYYEGLQEVDRLFAPPGAVSYGLGLAGMGDVDGDGIGDFAAGAPGDLFKGVCELGEVFVYSGKNRGFLYQLTGPGPRSMFGWNMESPGDFTGDGIDDLVIAAPACCVGCIDGQGPGRITFHDGPTGDGLGELDLAGIQPPVRTLTGWNLLAVGDLNGNGFGDVIVAYVAVWNSPSGRREFMAAFDGGTRELIYVVPWSYGDASSICSGYGANLTLAGDLNNDDFPDFVTSIACGQPRSLLDFISGAPIGVKSLGEPCGDGDGPLPRIGVSGQPLVGSDFRLYLSHVAPGQSAVLVLGTSSSRWNGLPLPLPLVRQRGCPLRVSPAVRISARARRVRPGEGVAEVAVSIPDDPTLIGTVFHAQWLLTGTPAHMDVQGGAPQVEGFPRRKWGTTRALSIRVITSPIDS